MGRGRGEKLQVDSPVSTEPNIGPSHNLWDHDLSWNRGPTLNQLSYPGPLVCFLKSQYNWPSVNTPDPSGVDVNWPFKCQYHTACHMFECQWLIGSGSGKRWYDSVDILKIELTTFSVKLDMEWEMERIIKSNYKILSLRSWWTVTHNWEFLLREDCNKYISDRVNCE